MLADSTPRRALSIAMVSMYLLEVADDVIDFLWSSRVHDFGACISSRSNHETES